MQLKAALDRGFQALALEEAGLSNSTTSSEVSWRKFPTPHPRISGFDVVAQQGGNWFYVVPMITFYLLLVELVEEKEARLRLGMRMMGLRTSAYWAAWGTYACTANLLTAAILTAAGNAAGFKVFTNSSLAIPILLYWSFGAAMSCMAGCMSTLVKRTKTAQTVAFTFVLIGFVFQVIIDTGYAALINILFASYVSFGVKAFRWILSLYPAFNQSVIFYGIAAKASSEFHRYTGTVVQGPGFHWADMARTRQVWFFGKQITVPAPSQAMLLIFANGVLYALLTLYLDAVLEGDQGTAAHPCFCCLPLRRLCNRAQGKAANDATAFSLVPPSPMPSPQPTQSASAGSGVAEEELVAAQVEWGAGGQLGTAGTVEGISARVLGLRKTYRSDACCGLFRGARHAGHALCPAFCPLHPGQGSSGGGAVHAVQGTSFTLRQDEILGLCGHNGAGKTTTIHILTGLFAATVGKAEILGHDVGSGAEVEQVQRLLGVCPQHDVLWPHLTAREHLLLFARIKGLKGGVPAAEAEAERLLAMVDLTAAADRGAGGFSGGMRRRLSTAIAVIGDPAVVFLDEPAAGLDPVNQRSLWSLIQKLKIGRSILLTSHSMLEVDTLADRVAIMAHGRMHALGTPLRLKREHGGGYRISLTLAPVPKYMRMGAGRRHRSGTYDSDIDFQLASLHGVLAAAGVCLGGVRVAAEHYDAGAVTLCIDDALLGAPFRLPYLLEWLTRDALAHRAACEELTSSEADDLPRLGTKWRSSDGTEMLPPVQGFVSEWAVSRATLQEVFLAVNEAADNSQDNDAELAADAVSAPGSAGWEVQGGGKSPTPSRLLAADASAAFAAATGKSTDGGSFTRLSEQAGSPGTTTSAGVGAADSRSSTRTGSDGLELPSLRPKGCTQSAGFASFRGLCLKNWTLLVRQRGQCACQVLSPLLVMALLLIVQEIIKYQFGSATTATAPSLVIPLNINQDPLLGSQQWPRQAANSPLQRSTLPKWLAAQAEAMPHLTASEVRHNWGVVVENLAHALWGQSQAAMNNHPSAAPSHVREEAGHVRSHSYRQGSLVAPLGEWHTQNGAFIPSIADTMQSEEPVIAINGSNCMEFFYISAAPLSVWPQVGALNSSGFGDGLLGRIPQSSCLLRNGSTIAVPFFSPKPTLQEVQTELYDTLETFNGINVRKLDYMPPCDDEPQGCPAYMLPDGELAFNKIHAQPAGPDSAVAELRLQYSFSVNDNDNRRYHRKNNFSRLGVPGAPAWVEDRALNVELARLSLLDMVQRAWLGHASDSLSVPTLGGFSEDIPERAVAALSLRGLGTLPEVQITSILKVVQVFGTFLYPIALTLQLPIGVYVLTMEKEERLLELQKSMGLSYTQYMGATYLLNLALYAALMVFFWSAGAALGFGLFLHTNFALLLQLFVGWGFALVSLGFFIASFLSSRRVATIVGYVVALFGSLTAEVLAVGVYGDVPPFSSGGRMPQWMFAFPIVGLTRAIYLMNFDCIFKSACMAEYAASMDPNTSDLYAAIWSLYICAFVYMLLALYFEAVLPKEYGIPAHVLFCCPLRVQRTVSAANAFVVASCSHKRPNPPPDSAQSLAASTRQSGSDLQVEMEAGGGLYTADGPASLHLHEPLLVSGGSDSSINTPLAIAVPRDAAAMRQPIALNPRTSSLVSEYHGSASRSLTPSSRAASSVRDKSGQHLSASGWGSDPPSAGASYAPFTSLRFPHLFAHPLDAPPADVQSVQAVLRDLSWSSDRVHLRPTSTLPKQVQDSLAYAAGEDTTVVAERVQVEQLVDDVSGQLCSDDPLVLRHIRKEFGVPGEPGKVAVSDMVLQVQAGETFGLLGENGAGKSTLINLITGVFPPSSGEATVCGHSISSAIDAVHGVTGVCPQHSLLWEDMTVEEHLLFFARLKGVPPALEAEHVKQSAQEVGLWQVRHRQAGGLSGGMKRRLSVAVAMIDTSGCRLVLLDEPSAGLDPASRRQLWRVISRAKQAQRRGIILVSHAMDEVELLSTRIGIMTHGRLRVLDTQGALRTKYGGGLYLSVNFPSKDDGAAVVWVMEVFPGAELENRFKGFASFFLPQGQPGSEIWNVFGLMHSAAAGQGGISDWAVGQVALEAVFQTVVKAHQPNESTIVKGAALA